MEAVVAAVKLELIERRLPDKELADLLGVSPATASRLLSGQRKLKLTETARIEDGLGLQRGFFLRAAGLVADATSVRDAIANDPALSVADRRTVLRVYDASLSHEAGSTAKARTARKTDRS